MDNNRELYHWGVKGMKWGVRRYQNRDGTLTPAGKKRYDQEMAKLKAEERIVKNREAVKAKMDKLDAKRKELDERKQALKPPKPVKPPKPEKPKKTSTKKSVKDMTDQELQEVVNRLSLEQRYAQLTPKKVSAGEKFLTEKVLPPLSQTLINVGKDYFTKALRKKVGLEDVKSEHDRLKEQAEIARYKKQIREFSDGSKQSGAAAVAAEIEKRRKAARDLIEAEEKKKNQS